MKKISSFDNFSIAQTVRRRSTLLVLAVSVGLMALPRESRAQEGLTCLVEPESAVLPPGSGVIRYVVATVLRDGVPEPDAFVELDVEGTSGVGASGPVSDEGTLKIGYSNQRGRGIDRIECVVTSGGETVTGDPVVLFWDDDLNGNGVGDTCDFSCDGFDGECAMYEIPCGACTDEDGDGEPEDCNQVPDCEQASASVSTIWFADRSLKPVSIEGVTDPDGDQVNIVIDSIFQDEPVLSRSFFSICPDAKGVGTSLAHLRAERKPWWQGGADGRVYHMSFTADDGRGGQCQGEVSVCVPGGHDWWRGTCVDQGPRFDSTVCSK